MEAASSSKSKKALFIYLILIFVFLLSVGGAYLYSRNKFGFLQKSESINKAPVPYNVNEKEILEKYYTSENIPFPPEYDFTNNEMKNLTLLRAGIIDRTISNRTGGVVTVNWNEGNKEEVFARLTNYRDEARASTELLKIMNELIERISTDEFLKDSFDSDFSGTFALLTLDKNPFLNDEVNKAFWHASEGTVSEIYELPGKFTFFMVAVVNNKIYNTYDEWLHPEKY